MNLKDDWYKIGGLWCVGLLCGVLLIKVAVIDQKPEWEYDTFLDGTYYYVNQTVMIEWMEEFEHKSLRPYQMFGKVAYGDIVVVIPFKEKGLIEFEKIKIGNETYEE